MLDRYDDGDVKILLVEKMIKVLTTWYDPGYNEQVNVLELFRRLTVNELTLSIHLILALNSVRPK